MTQKYKEFRNYMTNELGITRHDIEAWTKEAVATEVHKLVSGQNMRDIAVEAIKTSVRQVVIGSSYSGPTADMRKVIQAAVLDQIVGRINISVEEKQS